MTECSTIMHSDTTDLLPSPSSPPLNQSRPWPDLKHPDENKCEPRSCPKQAHLGEIKSGSPQKIPMWQVPCCLHLLPPLNFPTPKKACELVFKLRLQIDVGKGKHLRLDPEETNPLQGTFQRGATSIAASENLTMWSKHLHFTVLAKTESWFEDMRSQNSISMWDKNVICSVKLILNEDPLFLRTSKS